MSRNLLLLGAGSQDAAAAAGAAAALISGETDAFAMDFTAATPNMVVYDTVTPANVYDGDPFTKLGVVRTGSSWEINSSGLLVASTANVARYDRVLGTGVRRGLLVEPQRVNIVIQNRDLSNAAWVKSNTTGAKDQTGIDGVVNSASSLTATAGNGTCLQSITSGSASRVFSIYIKRITGSGVVEMTVDNGSTWTPVTVTGSWARVWIWQAAVTNPIVGFRIVTSGDAVAIDCAQCETGASINSITSPTITGAVGVTRNADNVSLALSSLPWLATAGSAKVKFIPRHQAAVCYAWGFHDGTPNNIIRGGIGAGDTAVFAITTAAASQASGAITGAITNEASNDYGTAWAANDVDGCINGGTVATDASVTLPTVTTFHLGCGAASGFLNGAIEKFVYVARHMTDGQLQALL